jgi:hypothetical protein
MAEQETTTVQTDDIDASIADVSLTDPNVQIGTTQTTDDTAATQGTDDAAATDGKTAQTTDDDAGKDAKTTEATADADKTSQASDDTTTVDKDATTEQQQQTPDERRQAAAAAWNERQRTRQQVAQQLDNSYGPQTEEQLIEQGLKPEQAAVEALRQDYAYNQERTRIAELNAGLSIEAVEIKNDFPVFDDQSPDYDPDFTNMVQETYKQAARLQTVTVTDQNGQQREIVSNADVPLYDYYKKMADIYNRGSTKGAQQQQTDVQDMLSRTENPGGSSSTQGPAAGSLEEMEERLGGVVIT